MRGGTLLSRPKRGKSASPTDLEMIISGFASGGQSLVPQRLDWVEQGGAAGRIETEAHTDDNRHHDGK